MASFWNGSAGSRRRAEVGAGFVAAEAPALQGAIIDALGIRRRGHESVLAALLFEHGADGRVVILWRNRYVGFVPQSHEDLVRAQVTAAGRAGLTADGLAYHDDERWRIWVGPPPETMPMPEPGIDELAPRQPTIFGLVITPRVLGRKGDTGPRPRT